MSFLRRGETRAKGESIRRGIVSVLFWSVVLCEGMGQSETLSGRVVIEGQAEASNVVVYLQGVGGEFEAPMQRPKMDHINLSFQPAVLAVLKGTTVNFPNSDPVFHSAFSTSPSNPFELGIYSEGVQKSLKFANPGVVEIFCHIHPYMHAFILVLENPYFTVTDRSGRYSLSGIPRGSYILKAWQGFHRATAYQVVTLDGRLQSGVDLVLHPEKVAGNP